MKRMATLFSSVLLGVLLFGSAGCDSGDSDGSVEVTLSEYNEIKLGMSLDEVEAIIGGGPTRSASATGPYANTGTAYQWVNLDGSAALITFEDDQVVLKSQVNLK